MKDDIKDKIDEYIQKILNKETITPAEYAVLVMEYERRMREV